jgi:hypothetical protein
MISSITPSDLEAFGVASHPKDNVISGEAPDNSNVYGGDKEFAEDSIPLRPDGYQKLDFQTSAELVAFFDPFVNNGTTTLHLWQVSVSEELCLAKPTAQHPYKFCLCAANGSGKDAYVVAPFAVWFALTKIKALVIITSSSGVQLQSQTENYIRSLCEKVNNHFGAPIFRIRQRYIKCTLTGSEIRLFATDEAGKAEGYHPMEPTAEMCIIVNEGKSVSEEIHGALRRCTGYNYWLEVSTPGQPFGFLYNAFTKWEHVKRVTAYDCPHISRDEIEYDRQELGEHSALFRSMRLALFTSLSGNAVIKEELVRQLRENPPNVIIGKSWPIRVGIDLAAGGDENCVIAMKGNELLLELPFREVDTTITADRIHGILTNELKLAKTHEYIKIDDGNVGHSITDMLVRMGWVNIVRVLNQAPAVRKQQYGNRGVEMWSSLNRILEERCIDITQFSDLLVKQLYNRYYKQQATQGRIFLEAKKEAKAHGRPSPDRADALVICLSDVSLDDFIGAEVATNDSKPNRAALKFATQQEAADWFDEQKYKRFEEPELSGKPMRGSLNSLMSRTFGKLKGYK